MRLSRQLRRSAAANGAPPPRIMMATEAATAGADTVSILFPNFFVVRALRNRAVSRARTRKCKRRCVHRFWSKGHAWCCRVGPDIALNRKAPAWTHYFDQHLIRRANDLKCDLDHLPVGINGRCIQRSTGKAAPTPGRRAAGRGPKTTRPGQQPALARPTPRTGGGPAGVVTQLPEKMGGRLSARAARPSAMSLLCQARTIAATCSAGGSSRAPSSPRTNL